jgi:lipopolysaccharide export LptBFGC system permease protein LptF
VVATLVLVVLAVAFLAAWHATGHHYDEPGLPYFVGLVAVLLVIAVVGRGIWIQRRRR